MKNRLENDAERWLNCSTAQQFTFSLTSSDNTF